jgi:hypothetical protein
MRRFRRFFWLGLALLGAGFSGLGAADFSQGRIKLTLHENTGHFSLYYLSGGSESRYEALFTDMDPRSSFLSVIVNDRTYRLGEASAFRLRTEEGDIRPSFMFESSFMTVRERFSFIKTAGSSVTNGIQIDIILRNLSNRSALTGFRLLLDTSLGEGSGKTPFVTGKQRITAETIIPGDTSDSWWVSKNENLSLMGSIRVPGGRAPDFLHFANWKRLNEIPWKMPYSSGRNFNFLPYSIGDSAVCYYYEPLPLAPGEEINCSILLASEDPAGFSSPGAVASTAPPSPREPEPLFDEPVVNSPAPPPAPPAPPDLPVPPDLPATRGLSAAPYPEEPPLIADMSRAYSPPGYSKGEDMLLLQNCINRIDRFIAGEIPLSEEELADMELTIRRIKIRYGLP